SWGKPLMPISKSVMINAVPHYLSIAIWHLIIRIDPACEPFGHLFIKSRSDVGGVIVRGTGSTELACLLELRFAILGVADDLHFFADNGVWLLTHLPGLSLALDLVPLYHSAAVWKWAEAVAALYRACGLIGNVADNLKGTNASDIF